MNWHQIGHVLWELGYWPGGIIVGNLIANIIWETPRTLTTEWRLRVHHKKLAKHITEAVNNNGGN